MTIALRTIEIEFIFIVIFHRELSRIIVTDLTWQLTWVPFHQVRCSPLWTSQQRSPSSCCHISVFWNKTMTFSEQHVYCVIQHRHGHTDTDASSLSAVRDKHNFALGSLKNFPISSNSHKTVSNDEHQVSNSHLLKF